MSGDKSRRRSGIHRALDNVVAHAEPLARPRSGGDERAGGFSRNEIEVRAKRINEGPRGRPAFWVPFRASAGPVDGSGATSS